MANIRDFVTTLDPVPVLSHTFHSYSQLWVLIDNIQLKFNSKL